MATYGQCRFCSVHNTKAPAFPPVCLVSNFGEPLKHTRKIPVLTNVDATS